MMAAADISAPDFKDASYWWEAAPPSKAAVPALPDRAETALPAVPANPRNRHQ
jgi:hypothetical protein